MQVAVSFSLPEEGGDLQWEDDREDPKGGPSRPRRDGGKEPELSESGGISEEVKSWFRRELSAQLGALCEEIYGWTHPMKVVPMQEVEELREVVQPDNAYNPPNIAEGGSTPPPDEPVLSKDPAAFESQSAVPTTFDAQEVRRENDRCTDIETFTLQMYISL
ncbi:hypothetical protein Bca52824_003194 [Brassica carinata]|uniref:Uncharacterized protein n=1 Tax=Brassica carinata TaxID=52824 RepID=A0A8X7WLK7_BRACI|nr:hypothetical protein Bca52824_003194 [Brassica carinata]